MARPELPGFNPDGDPDKIIDREIDKIRRVLSQRPPHLPDASAVQSAVNAGKLSPNPAVVEAITKWRASRHNKPTDV